MKPIQLLLLPLVSLALLKVLAAYKQHGMRAPVFLFWVSLWVGTAVVITFPDATSFLAHHLGIGRGADLIVYATLLGVSYLIFRIQVMLDRFEQEITEIVRALALERLVEPDGLHPTDLYRQLHKDIPRQVNGR
jgi:hypothetical protein